MLRLSVRRLCVGASVLLLAGCLDKRPVLEDTATLGGLGELRLGMSRAEARRIADRHASREEWMSCRSHPDYVYCSRTKVRVGSERNLGLLFHRDTLGALAWTRAERFTSLRQRYAKFGEPRWERAGRPPRRDDIFATWVSTDSTVIRTAVCHEGRSRPICKLLAASTTPAEVRARAAEQQAGRPGSARTPVRAKRASP